jgi:hypothetical protein
MKLLLMMLLGGRVRRSWRGRPVDPTDHTVTLLRRRIRNPARDEEPQSSLRLRFLSCCCWGWLLLLLRLLELEFGPHHRARLNTRLGRLLLLLLGLRKPRCLIDVGLGPADLLGERHPLGRLQWHLR